MTESEEQCYVRGQQQLADTLLGTLRTYLPTLDKEKLALVRERNAVVQSLRELCSEFGDNDWPDTLHLGDVIENHLGRHLRKG